MLMVINQERFLLSFKILLLLRKEQETERIIGERVQEEMMKIGSHDHQTAPDRPQQIPKKVIEVSWQLVWPSHLGWSNQSGCRNCLQTLDRKPKWSKLQVVSTWSQTQADWCGKWPQPPPTIGQPQTKTKNKTNFWSFSICNIWVNFGWTNLGPVNFFES